MTYVPRIVPMYKTSKYWGGGKWEFGKENDDEIGRAKFTGKEERELHGYKLFMMMRINGKDYSITESIPRYGAELHNTYDDARDYFYENHQDIKPGNMFQSYVYSKGTLDGEIEEFEL